LIWKFETKKKIFDPNLEKKIIRVHSTVHDILMFPDFHPVRLLLFLPPAGREYTQAHSRPGKTRPGVQPNSLRAAVVEFAGRACTGQATRPGQGGAVRALPVR
jgi:hypothetical protein